MFSFNGGPGRRPCGCISGRSAQRVKMLDDGLMPPPPYELVDNDQTWLDQTDMVFIDPVGTGYSRATKQELAAKFFGLNGDIESVGEFIRLYLGDRNAGRHRYSWSARATARRALAGLSNCLFEHGVGLNGILLISTVMNFQTIRFADNNDMPLVLDLAVLCDDGVVPQTPAVSRCRPRPSKQVAARSRNLRPASTCPR